MTGGVNNRHYVISHNPKNEGATWKVITWGPLRCILSGNTFDEVRDKLVKRIGPIENLKQFIKITVNVEYHWELRHAGQMITIRHEIGNSRWDIWRGYVPEPRVVEHVGQVESQRCIEVGMTLEDVRDRLVKRLKKGEQLKLAPTNRISL